jgi:STIMATE family
LPSTYVPAPPRLPSHNTKTNVCIQTTIGIPILVLLLRILHRLFLHTPLANPPESLKSGNYGHPPQVTWWLKQSIIYFLGLFGMKLCVFILFQLLPFLGWVGDWALRWTEGKEWVQITFVMLIFPLIMNAAQYYIIDSFIKDPVGSYEEIGQGENGHDENEGLIRPRSRASQDSDDDEEEERREIEENRKGTGSVRTKVASPTPLPAYAVLDDRPGSSSVGSRSLDEDDKK